MSATSPAVDSTDRNSSDSSHARETTPGAQGGASSGPGLKLGSVTAKALLHKLENRPGLIDKAVSAIEGGLEATTTVWSAEKKDTVAVPDYRARLDAAKLVFAYLEGLPLQRTLNMNVNQETPSTGKLTPGILKEMKALVAAAESGAIPVETTVSEKRG